MKNAWLLGMLFFLFSVHGIRGNEKCDLSISGIVLDEHDGSALAYSTIWIPSLSKGVSANKAGEFKLSDLCKGTYVLVISHIGCEPDTISLKLKNSIKRTFLLEHHLEELQEVEINEQKQNVGLATEKLNANELSNKSGKPLAEILEQLNGVNSLQTGSNISKPVIGGFTANRVQIVNQGIQFQSQSWGDEHAPEIDPFAAANYTVIKGAGAVKHSGGAIGGLVLIEPRALPRTAGISGELNSLYATNNRMFNSSLLLEGNSKLLPNFSWRAQGSWKRSGNIKTPDYYQKNTGVRELNGSLDLGYYGKNWNSRIYFSQFNSDIGIFSGAHIGNLTDLQVAIDRADPREVDQAGFSYNIDRPKQRIIHELIKGEFNWYSDKWGKVVYRFSRQFNIREEFDKELPRNDELAALDIPEFSLSLESFTNLINWEVADGDFGKLEAGAQWIDIRNTVNSFTDFIPDYTSDIYSMYALHHWESGNWRAEVGIRLDQTELAVSKFNNLSRVYEPFSNSFLASTNNVGVAYQLAEKSELQFNITYAERAPAINELYSDGLHHGSASLEFGNRELGKEKSFALAANYSTQKQKWSYKLYGFTKWIEDFIYLEPNGLELTIRGSFPAYYWTNADARISGMDHSFNYELNKDWNFYHKLSLLWGYNRTANNFLINMPANRTENGLSYQFPLKTENRELKVSAGHQLVMRQERFNPEQEFAPPPEAYQLIQASINYSITINKQTNVEFGIRGENLFNERYRDYLNRFRFYTDEQGRDIVFRVQLTF